MLTNLYLVRHAHSIYTADEWKRPLSERGFRDARYVTKLLQYQKMDHIISSPYQRAIQTVQGVADYYDKGIEIIDEFKERKLAENAVTDFQVAMTKVWNDWQFSWGGGESNAFAQQRGIRATYHILGKYSGKNIVIGTHGNIMVLIMNYFDARYDFHFWRALQMPDVYQLTFNGTILVEANHIIGGENNQWLKN